MNSISTQFFLLYRSWCVAEYRHSSSYLGAVMGAPQAIDHSNFAWMPLRVLRHFGCSLVGKERSKGDELW